MGSHCHRRCYHYKKKHPPTVLSLIFVVLISVFSRIRTSLTTTNHADLQSYLLFAEAARGVEGCYDKYPMACRKQHQGGDGATTTSNNNNQWVNGWNGLNYFKNLQELDDLCYELQWRIFKGNRFIYDNVPVHRTYLNGIEASDPFCSRIHQAYPYCSFCDPKPAWQCRDYSPTCVGLLPTAEEIIDDTTDERYSWVTSQADIDEVCEPIQNMFRRPLELFQPYSIPLCERRPLVNHLCYGFCDQPCFDKTNLPSCGDAIATEAETIQQDPTTVGFLIEENCENLRQTAFEHFGYHDIFNTTLHREFLLQIPLQHPFCDTFKEVYPYCFWCKSPNDLCFHEANKPSCDYISQEEEEEKEIASSSSMIGNDNDITVIGYLDVGRVCRDIAHRLGVSIWGYNVKTFADIIDHNLDLFLMANTTTCTEAKLAYHQCVWCDVEAQDYAAVLLAEDDSEQQRCQMDVTAPDSIIEDILTMHNISIQTTTTTTPTTPSETSVAAAVRDGNGPTTEECAFLRDWWTEREPLYSLEGLYETVAMENLCSGVLCPPEEPANGKLLPKAGILRNYLGTKSDNQRKALIWSSRFSAFLSFFGAFYILVDVLRNPKNRQTVYHQILIGMATFDLVTAIAWGFATAPIDAKEHNDIEGAVGTDATCTAQAFFIQLGFTSVFYNVSLSIYYLLIIVYSWREFQLKKISPYLHAVPITVGLALAFGAIPSYKMLEYGCHMKPHEKTGDPVWHVLVFVVLPLGSSIVFITGSMLVIYVSVRKQALKAKRWQQSGSNNNTNTNTNPASKMEEAVFWQCASYVLAFYITWPIMFCVYLFSVESHSLGLALTVAFVAPLQGFSNFVVFLRTKLKNQKSKKGKKASNKCNARFFQRLFGYLQANATKSPQQPSSDNSKIMDPVFGEMDPSAALPLYRDKISSERASSVRQSQDQVKVSVRASSIGGGSVVSASVSNPLPGTVVEEGNDVVSGGEEEESEEQMQYMDSLGESTGNQRNNLQVVVNLAPDGCQSSQEIEIEDHSLRCFDDELGETMPGSSTKVSLQNTRHHPPHKDLNQQEPLYHEYTTGQQQDWRKYLLQRNPT